MNCELLNLKNARPSKEKTHSPVKITEPLTLIYHQILTMIETGEVECYNTIEKMLYAHLDKIPLDESNNVLRYLHNFAGKMMREGDPLVWVEKIRTYQSVVYHR